MMTRSGVAKRLGKSIASVRRMEGSTLHPRLDSRGFHLFDPAEVEAAARGSAPPPREFPSFAHVTPTEGPADAPWQGDAHSEWDERLRHEVDRARRETERRARERWREAEVQIRRDAQHKAELERVLSEAVHVLESLSPAMLRHIDDEDIDSLLELAASLRS